jgi:hypothetical protein
MRENGSRAEERGETLRGERLSAASKVPVGSLWKLRKVCCKEVGRQPPDRPRRTKTAENREYTMIRSKKTRIVCERYRRQKRQKGE